MSADVARDGGVWVCADRCSSCIFRPGNLMHLSPGRVRSMVDAAVAAQGTIPCHETLEGPAAICRGFWDAHRHRVGLLQVAERLGLVREQAS